MEILNVNVPIGINIMLLPLLLIKTLKNKVKNPIIPIYLTNFIHLENDLANNDSNTILNINTARYKGELNINERIM
jgi:hypothetical protein